MAASSARASSPEAGPALAKRGRRPDPAHAVDVDLPPCHYSTSSEGDIGHMLGRPHYSYRFAEAKFRAAFGAAGVPLRQILMPEYHAHDAGRVGDPRAVHLIFRSTEHIRLLKPAVNICCYAWEFEVLRDWTGPGEHPFRNQVRMLSLCDEIWVPCTFTRDVLRRHGLINTQVIPAPIAMPSTPRRSRRDALSAIGQLGLMPLVANFLRPHGDMAQMAANGAVSLIDVLAPPAADAASPVYLSVLNPEDFRKNLDGLLRGFHHFQQVVPRAVLVVKLLTSASRFPLERAIAEVLPNKLASGSVIANDHIVFLNAFLSDEDLGALYEVADFYLCASLAEGQNLPLLEAMAHGVVPVSPAHTAMTDYVTADNAFVIETTRVAAPSEHLDGANAGKPYHVDACSARQVYDGLLHSAQAAPADRHRRAELARQTVRERFGIEAVWPAIAARLTASRALPRRDEA